MFSAVLQLLVYQKFGGISNYIEAATREANREGEGEFAGSGIVFLFSESFPILAMMGFAAYAVPGQGGAATIAPDLGAAPALSTA